MVPHSSLQLNCTILSSENVLHCFISKNLIHAVPNWLTFLSSFKTQIFPPPRSLLFRDPILVIVSHAELLILTTFIYFLFFKLIYFNWKLITLQYCGDFCLYTDVNQPWVYMCPPSWTSLPSPSSSHSSGLCQCTGFECPVSSMEVGLVICFTYYNIRVSMLFSQIIPPLPSPSESKSLFFVSLLKSCI